MKKRAQVPDARTYTTLFRGLAWHAKFPNSLDRALSIYHSMFADTAPVKPSIIHTNAVLKVCALSGDMDALLGVAAKLPERGNGAPDTLTYTIILNAIRNTTVEAMVKQQDGSRITEGRKRAVLQGRRLWEEIRERWARGDLFMDEELVCAMGRTLLLGEEQDLDDVLSMLEQTMGVPRQVPRLGDPARHGARQPEERQLNGFLEEGVIPSPIALANSTNPTRSEATSHLPPLDNLATAVSPFSPLPNLNPSTLVRPSRNTLSLALEACTSMHLPRPAQDYWGLLTSPDGAYNIPPDTNNYHSYLRLLRLQRASKLAVELVNDMADGTIKSPTPGRTMLEPKVFRIAMSACVRDKNNSSALSHASGLVKTMLATLEDTDPPTLTSYLDLALSSRYSKDNYRRLLEVEKQAQSGWYNIKSQLSYVEPQAGSGKMNKERQREEQAVEVAQRMVGLYDKIFEVGKEGMERTEAKRVRDEKARVSAWVQRRSRRRERPAGAALATGKRGGEEELVEEGRNGGEEQIVEAGDRPLKAHTKSFSFIPGPRGDRQNERTDTGYEDEAEDGGEDECEDADEALDRPMSKHEFSVHRGRGRSISHPSTPPRGASRAQSNNSNPSFATDPRLNNQTYLPPRAARATTEWASWKADHRVDKRDERKERQRAAIRRRAEVGLKSERQDEDEDFWAESAPLEKEVRQPWSAGLRNKRGGFGSETRDSDRGRERTYRSEGWGNGANLAADDRAPRQQKGWAPSVRDGGERQPGGYSRDDDDDDDDDDDKRPRRGPGRTPAEGGGGGGYNGRRRLGRAREYGARDADRAYDSHTGRPVASSHSRGETETGGHEEGNNGRSGMERAQEAAGRDGILML